MKLSERVDNLEDADQLKRELHDEQPAPVEILMVTQIFSQNLRWIKIVLALASLFMTPCSDSLQREALTSI